VSDGVPYDFLRDKKLAEIEKPGDFPAGKCYVIQVFENRSVYHEGDERSRTNPGHGYPAYTESFTVVRQFVTQDLTVWREKIQLLYSQNKNRTDICAFTMEKANVQARVEISFQDTGR
jgi:hypothetical protein